MRGGAFILLLIGLLIVYLGVTKKFDCLTSFISCVLSVAVPSTTVAEEGSESALPAGSTSPVQMGGIQIPSVPGVPGLPKPPTLDPCKLFPNFPGCAK